MDPVTDTTPATQPVSYSTLLAFIMADDSKGFSENVAKYPSDVASQIYLDIARYDAVNIFRESSLMKGVYLRSILNLCNEFHSTGIITHILAEGETNTVYNGYDWPRLLIGTLKWDWSAEMLSKGPFLLGKDWIHAVVESDNSCLMRKMLNMEMYESYDLYELIIFAIKSHAEACGIALMNRKNITPELLCDIISLEDEWGIEFINSSEYAHNIVISPSSVRVIYNSIYGAAVHTASMNYIARVIQYVEAVLQHAVSRNDRPALFQECVKEATNKVNDLDHYLTRVAQWLDLLCDSVMLTAVNENCACLLTHALHGRTNYPNRMLLLCQSITMQNDRLYKLLAATPMKESDALRIANYALSVDFWWASGGITIPTDKIPEFLKLAIEQNAVKCLERLCAEYKKCPDNVFINGKLWLLGGTMSDACFKVVREAYGGSPQVQSVLLGRALAAGDSKLFTTLLKDTPRGHISYTLYDEVLRALDGAKDNKPLLMSLRKCEAALGSWVGVRMLLSWLIQAHDAGHGYGGLFDVARLCALFADMCAE